MKTKSTIAPEKFLIGERNGSLIEVSFFDRVEEIQEEDTIMYQYSVFKLKTVFRENLEEYINEHYDAYLALAKETSYQLEASKVREKRNKMLEDSDKFLLLDRLGITLPSEISTSTMLTSIKEFFDNLQDVLSGEWAKYRQDLRDLTEQDGFPYDVTFPKKPDE